jgi:hypothetical protein
VREAAAAPAPFGKNVTAMSYLRVPAEIRRNAARRGRSARRRRRRTSMRRAVMGSVMVGAIVSLLVRLAWSQAKDLDETITIWPTRGGSIR